MLKFHDRIYGTIDLPDLAREVAETCPVVLRLREVRMANIPFFTYPSFANVDRYEHSLGVAHLAWRWARKNNLPRDLAVALTIAALYHDGATPGFGHLFEEFLGRFGFDHERALVNMLLGKPDDIPGREDGQIFLGLQCKLRDILPRTLDPSSPLTPISIADLASGKGIFGRLIKGDIDFDNIDNVIRATSAMGLAVEESKIHPYEVIDALVYEDGEIKLERGSTFVLESWSELRRRLYHNILNNAYEFRAQAAIKWAIEECAIEDYDLSNQSAWRLTDPMLTFEHLRKVPFSRFLIDKVRRGSPPELLFSTWIDNLLPLIGEESKETIQVLCREISNLINMDVYVNYYLDKRERLVELKITEKTSYLFNDNNPTYIKNSQGVKSFSGVVGVIGVSRVERAAMQSRNGNKVDVLSKRSVKEEAVIEIFEKVLKQPINTFSFGWVGTSQPKNRQQLLFETI